jgi:hypothetical protein
MSAFKEAQIEQLLASGWRTCDPVVAPAIAVSR